MFKTGILRIPHPTRPIIEGGPNEREYDPRPRSIPATPEQIARLKSSTGDNMPAKTKVTPQVKAQIKELLQHNVPVRDIAETVGVAKSTVSRHTSGIGMKPRKRGRKTSVPQLPSPSPAIAGATPGDTTVLTAQEMVTFPRLETALDDVPAPAWLKAYVPPAIIRQGSLRPPQPELISGGGLEQLTNLAQMLTTIKAIPGVQVAGAVNISLSLEVEI